MSLRCYKLKINQEFRKLKTFTWGKRTCTSILEAWSYQFQKPVEKSFRGSGVTKRSFQWHKTMVAVWNHLGGEAFGGHSLHVSHWSKMPQIFGNLDTRTARMRFYWFLSDSPGTKVVFWKTETRMSACKTPLWMYVQKLSSGGHSQNAASHIYQSSLDTKT